MCLGQCQTRTDNPGAPVQADVGESAIWREHHERIVYRLPIIFQFAVDAKARPRRAGEMIG